MICNWTMISTHYNCIGILVRINLKMAMWVIETCLWWLCNKITFINPRAVFGSFKNFMHLINAQNVGYSITRFPVVRFWIWQASTFVCLHPAWI